MVLGTPAEEAGHGKAYLIDGGAFEGADVAMMIHPAPVNIAVFPSLALATVTAHFFVTIAATRKLDAQRFSTENQERVTFLTNHKIRSVLVTNLSSYQSTRAVFVCFFTSAV